MGTSMGTLWSSQDCRPGIEALSPLMCRRGTAVPQGQAAPLRPVLTLGLRPAGATRRWVPHSRSYQASCRLAHACPIRPPAGSGLSTPRTAALKSRTAPRGHTCVQAKRITWPAPKFSLDEARSLCYIDFGNGHSPSGDAPNHLANKLFYGRAD